MKGFVRILTALVGLALLAGGVHAALAQALSPEGQRLEVSIELEDGEGNAVATLTARRLFSEKVRSVAAEYALFNHGERALTQLEYRVKYLDADGNVLLEPPRSLEMFMDNPVQPGETREFVQRHYFDGAELSAGILLEPMGVKDAEELPPWTDPRPGNPLPVFANDPAFAAHFENLDDNLPVTLYYHVDEAVDDTITDPDEIRVTIEKLRDTRIGEPVNIGYTDSAVNYWFVMADGSGWGVGFEAPGLLSWHGKNYEVID